MDTIFALSSGGLPSAVAVIRISGSQTKTILQNLIGMVPKARYMHYSALYAHSNFINSTKSKDASDLFSKEPKREIIDECCCKRTGLAPVENN